MHLLISKNGTFQKFKQILLRFVYTNKRKWNLLIASLWEENLYFSFFHSNQRNVFQISYSMLFLLVTQVNLEELNRNFVDFVDIFYIISSFLYVSMNSFLFLAKFFQFSCFFCVASVNIGTLLWNIFGWLNTNSNKFIINLILFSWSLNRKIVLFGFYMPILYLEHDLFRSIDWREMMKTILWIIESTVHFCLQSK